MPEIIQDWLGTRLGVVLDLAPEKFGLNTKNGVLLARLLYSYNVIPQHILQKIKESKNYYDCYENLKILKPWLQYIGVVQDDSVLQKVARGESSSAISLFYAVYLNLEKKNTLDYLLTQKEKRFSEDSCKRKFKVEWVPEKNIGCDSNETKYQDPATSISLNNEMLEWHRKKCKEIKEKILKVKSKFSKITRKKHDDSQLVPPNIVSSQTPDKGTTEAEEVIKGIGSFEKKHVQKCQDLTYSELIELKNSFGKQTCPFPNEKAARDIVDRIKHRKKSEVYARNFQKSMQHMVLDEHWKEIIEEQNRKFENVVYETLSKQSQFEKQMTSKLCQLRHRKKIFAENKKLIESLKMKQRDKEFNDELMTKMELKETSLSNKEFERERLTELHRKVYNEKVKARHEFLKCESRFIVESIADMAIRISETRRLTSCQIPKAFLKDLKELFFKNMPIFDLLDNYGELLVDDLKLIEGKEEGNDREKDGFDECFDEIKIQEKHRQDVLNETDFMDYINLSGPWMVQLLSPEMLETETQQVVLGYIVHKILETKYPFPNLPSHVPIKPMKPTAVIQDIESDAYKMLADLLEPCKILVVQISDAINFVLSVYKEELSVVRDIDITFQNLTNKAFQNKADAGKDTEVKKKVLLMKKEEVVTQPESTESNPLNKETQTPRIIPEEDPILSMNAAVGKKAFEALGAGDPVPDSIIISAIVAYVSYKQADYDGWVLINYPRFYSQASDLECMLTGYRLMPLGDETCTLEDVENFTFREANADFLSSDLFATNRVSRLVPKPNVEIFIPEDPKSYFNIFIKLRKSSDSLNHQLKESNPGASMEKFYAQQNIFQDYEYSTLNFQTIKNIGKILLNEGFKATDDSGSIVAKTSEEIFGSAIFELNNKWGVGKKKNGKGNEITTVGDSKKVKLKEVNSFENVENFSECIPSKTAEDSKNVRKKSGEPQSSPPKPGDSNWEWAMGNQPDSLLVALASLWENMEATFIDDLKDMFFCLRTHRLNVLSYCKFIKKSVQQIMGQPDDKQQVLGDFQQMFNEIDIDLRPDSDIKCELHVRVSELEEALLGIADERKANAIKDLSKITQDGWVADEMANLVNHFLNILQLEADRCLITCQILIDYYTSFLQKCPDEKVIDKITVAKLQIKDRKYSILASSPNKMSSSQLFTPKNSEFRRSSRILADQSTRFNVERASKTRSWGDKRRKSSDSSFLAGASEVITEILVKLSLPYDGTTPFHNFFKDSVSNATNEIIAMIEGFLSEVKKGDKLNPKNAKKGSETNPPVAGNVSLEWETALNNELSRFLFRTKLILGRGIFDMNEFLATILNTLSSLSENINEIYLKEVKSISECCKVFRCCIEEEISVPVYLILKAEDFYVEDDPQQLKTVDPDHTGVVKEDEMLFSVNQLCLLFEKLRRVAPDGEIIKRSLLFILEDFKAFNSEVKSCDCFPKAWKLLDPNDLRDIMNEIYQDLEIVPWKDFIIYSLKTPIPSESEMLFMRKTFRDFDLHSTELITRTNYDKIKFWFECSTYNFYVGVEESEQIKDLLFKMYQVDDDHTNYSALLLAFCKDENPIFGFTKALALIIGKKVSTNEHADEEFPFMAEEGGESGDQFFENYEVKMPKKPCKCSLYSSVNDRKCIPKERRNIRCPCGIGGTNVEEDDSLSFSETWESEGLEQAEEEEANSSFMYNYKESDNESVVSSVPIEILSSLFKASYPSLSQLSALLDCKQTFQDTLNSIYDALTPQNDRVKVYKLLRHKFVSRLIQSTNKFKFIKIENIVLNKLKSKKMLGSSSCIPEKESSSMSFD